MALPTYDDLVAENAALRAEVAELQARLADLTRRLDAAVQAGKRQAAPFRKGPPKPYPKTPGHKSGDAHGRPGHRPPPDQVEECYDAPLRHISGIETTGNKLSGTCGGFNGVPKGSFGLFLEEVMSRFSTRTPEDWLKSIRDGTAAVTARSSTVPGNRT